MAKKRVMVVDDEEHFLKIVKLNLEATKNFEVLTLNSAENIVAEVNRFCPDVILLDLLLPSMGGIEACEALNNDPVGSKIPIVIISALDKETDKLKAFKLGVVDYITKPIDVNTMVAVIEKALRGFNQR
ncbi:MAG: response regulator [Candidatus Omnitrophica bacterium]|nr:response regulator [Candidatus Omnitrophota bacterium]